MCGSVDKKKKRKTVIREHRYNLLYTVWYISSERGERERKFVSYCAQGVVVAVIGVLKCCQRHWIDIHDDNYLRGKRTA